MKISNSAALFLASSAALVSQHNSNAFTTTSSLSVNKKTFSSSARSAEVSDGGKSKIDEENEMQLKRMNYHFGRGAGSPGDSDGIPQVNPLIQIQSYVPVAESVLTRKNIAGDSATCIVSGSRATPELFYLLNSEDSAFGFNKIVSVSQDVAKTKKTLLTRTARYTGLLSKLAHEEGTVVPPASVLEEASSWIALVDTPEDLQTLIASADKVENLSILFFYSPETESQLESLSSELMAANPSASLVLVPQADVEEDPNEDPLEAEFKPTPIMYYYQPGKGEPLVPEETPEVKEGEEAPVSIEPTLVHDPAFSFEEANRLAIECLQLQAGAGKTLMLQCIEKKGMVEMMQLVKQDSPSTQNLFTKLVLGLREAGYERPQEVAYMMEKGVAHMQEAISKFGNANPGTLSAQKAAASGQPVDDDVVTTTNAWWEDPEFQKLVKESSLRKGEAEAAKKLMEEEQEAGETTTEETEAAL
mmetsp:Transcript_21458/g.52861  ORF Transcript_21458/g.52861 Transcript_21458/m.52861 type:complete len:474 (-) Transcript_21458:1592-3013(-)